MKYISRCSARATEPSIPTQPFSPEQLTVLLTYKVPSGPLS